MDASACGVFATVIPVLLLAGYFSGYVIDWAAEDDSVLAVLLVQGALTTLGEITALVGVYHGHLAAGWAQVVLVAALAALPAMPASVAAQVMAKRRAYHNRGVEDTERDGRDQDPQD